MDGGGPCGDRWRDAGAYAHLVRADRMFIAWEWLRRDLAYRIAAEQALRGRPQPGPVPPERWGLHAFEPACLPVPEARPVWAVEVHPHVLVADAERPLVASDSLDLERLGDLARIVEAADGREHLLVSDGIRAIRIDLASGSFRQGPVRLRYRLRGFAAAERPLLTLRRLIILNRTGRFSRSLHPDEARARRWVLMLRACDALAAGAGQREIAAGLLSRTASELRWRSREPSVRSQAQRLVCAARAMARGRYLELLR